MTDEPVYKNIMEILVSEDGDEPLSEVSSILSEDVLDPTREKDQFYYLLRFEQYLDECDIYAFDGWSEGEIARAPEIEKFWVTFDVYVGDDCDLSGALRVKGKDEQNVIRTAKWGEGTIVRFRILRRILDGIEQRNRRMAQKEVEEFIDG